MKTESKFLKIWRPNAREKLEDAVTFEARNYHCFDNEQANLEVAVESYAEDFYYDCDGNTMRWPIEFSVADEDGNFMGIVIVDMEHSIEFRGVVKK